MNTTVPPTLAEDLALARQLAEQAAEMALQHLRRGITPITKADGSPVTEADREIESSLRAWLARERPEDAVLGEELGASGTSNRRWLIDPIDGTANYIAGRPEWGNHLALEVDGSIVVGVITRPELGRSWWASRGAGAFRSDIGSAVPPLRLRVSQIREWGESRVSLWAPPSDPRVLRFQRHARWVEPNLNAVLRIAQGEMEAVVDPSGKPWDHAPSVVIIEEAGGRFSDRFGGRRLDLGEGRFSNGLIHERLGEQLDTPAS